MMELDQAETQPGREMEEVKVRVKAGKVQATRQAGIKAAVNGIEKPYIQL
jgi:hypothetical protein